jgi:hypothetical protein
MSLSLILWYIFCFFYGNRVADYFLSDKPKNKPRTIFFLVLTVVFLGGVISLLLS